MRRLILTLCLLLNPLAHSEGASSNTMNLRFSPLGLVVGAIGIHLDFKSIQSGPLAQLSAIGTSSWILTQHYSHLNTM